jgi:O-antigen ligase
MFLNKTGGSMQMYGVNYLAAQGILAGHVALANNMNQMIPLVWFLLFSIRRKALKAIALILLSLFIIALIGSGSRGGIVGLTVAGACLVFFSQKRLKTLFLVSLTVMIIGIFIGSSVMHTASRINSGSTEHRLKGLSHGLEMILKGNLIGVGPGCYLIARKHYFHYYMESHNIYGQIMGDLGIPGVIVTFLFVRSLFRCSSWIKQRLVALNREDDFIMYLMTGVQVSLIVRLVISMGSHGLYYFYWYVMAALIVVSNYIVVHEYMYVCNKNPNKITNSR